MNGNGNGAFNRIIINCNDFASNSEIIMYLKSQKFSDIRDQMPGCILELHGLSYQICYLFDRILRRKLKDVDKTALPSKIFIVVENKRYSQPIVP